MFVQVNEIIQTKLFNTFEGTYRITTSMEMALKTFQAVLFRALFQGVERKQAHRNANGIFVFFKSCECHMCFQQKT